MKVIHKQQVILGINNLKLPCHAKIIRFAPDPTGTICIWYILNAYVPNMTENVSLAVVGTGHNWEDHYEYIDSCQQDRYVWHLLRKT